MPGRPLHRCAKRGVGARSDCVSHECHDATDVGFVGGVDGALGAALVERAQNPASVALDEEPDDGFPAARKVVNRDLASRDPASPPSASLNNLFKCLLTRLFNRVRLQRTAIYGDARMARAYRRERRFGTALNVPMTQEMREALETIADEVNISVVEAARRCIGSATEASGAQTPPRTDKACRERVMSAVAKALHGQPSDTTEEQGRQPSVREIDRAIREAMRLGLHDIVTLLESDEYHYLAFDVNAALERDSESARITAAKQRLMSHFTEIAEEPGDKEPSVKNTSIYDDDLNPVLEKASNEELDILHDIIMTKSTEMLTVEEAYKLHSPDHKQYVDLLAKEVRDFGGNTFANVIRGFEGPAYHEVVCDVAKSIKAPFSKDQDIATVEASILATVLAKAFEKMTEDEKRAILDGIGKSNKSWMGGTSAMAFQSLFRAGGFASYQIMLIVVNAIVKAAVNRGLLTAGLSFGANAALTRSMAIAVGPIGWAVTGLWTLIQVAGPSYKVTIPSVAYVAMLRAGQKAVECGNCGAVLNESFQFCSECGNPLASADEAGEPEPSDA